MKYFIATCLMLITVNAVAPVKAAAPPILPATNAATKFVQEFYDWYLQEIDKQHAESPVEYALKTKQQLFSQKLVKALDEDFAAQAKNPDYIVGIDFDPFLNAQDTCGPYKTGKVSHEGNTYRVEVWGQCSGETHGQPDVIAEIRSKNNSWTFVDFIYPGNGDLLAILQALKKERVHPSK